RSRAANVEDDGARLFGRHREMQFPSRGGDARLVGFQIKIEVGECVILDVARGVAQRLELGEPLGGKPPPLGEAEPFGGRALKLRVCERAARVILELGRGERHGALRFGSGSPIAGPSAMPASTSATWRTATRRPERCNLPAIFMRQPRSPASSISAPVAAT